MYKIARRMGASASYADGLEGPEWIPNEAALGCDALLPTQLYGSRRGSAALEPLKRLMMAILLDALRCVQRNFEAATLRKRREFREAQNWVFTDRNDGIFSFNTVCSVLDTDPDLLRQRLIRFQCERVESVGHLSRTSSAVPPKTSSPGSTRLEFRARPLAYATPRGGQDSAPLQAAR
jgi:hypothetical protein